MYLILIKKNVNEKTMYRILMEELLVRIFNEKSLMRNP